MNRKWLVSKIGKKREARDTNIKDGNFRRFSISRFAHCFSLALQSLVFFISMWPVLLAAAVVGSTGLVAKHFLSTSNADPSLIPEKSKQCNETSEDPGFPIDKGILEDFTSQHLVVPSGFGESGLEGNSEKQDGLFTFSSSGPPRQGGLWFRNNKFRKKPVFGCRGSKSGFVAKVEQRSEVEVRLEQRKGGRRLPFCLKRRRITKNLAAKGGCSSSKDGSLFGLGLSIGILYFTSTGKAEISKLSKAMDETARVVQEIKTELNRRKSSRPQQSLNSVNIDMNNGKMSARHVIIDERNSGLRDVDAKILSLPNSDDGECGSSALTEEPDGPVLEMDHLEAELEFELLKIPGCIIGDACHEEMKSNLHKIEFPGERCHGTDNQNFYSQSYGVSATELNHKLSHLLIEQQENQINELESELHLVQSKLHEKESELHLVQSKLHEKESELQALKDCVRRFTDLSLSTVSDDETETCTDQTGASDWNTNNMDFESKQSVVGMKRPLGS